MKFWAGIKNRRLTVGVLLAFVAGGALLSGLVAWNATQEMRRALLQQGLLEAQAVNQESVQSLAYSEAGTNSPVYQRLKEQFITLRRADPLCRSIYLLGRRGTNEDLSFLVDSDSVGSTDYFPSGKAGWEFLADCRKAFATRRGVVGDTYLDRNGKSVMALVPLVDPRTIISGMATPEGARAVLGMKFDASGWNRKLALASLPPILLTLVMVAILVAGAELLSRRAGMTGLPSRWTGSIEPAMAAAFGLALTAYFALMFYQRETRERDEAFRQLAASRTTQVAEVLRNASGAEIEGLAHFYENSTNVTPEQFRRFTGYLAHNPNVQAWEWITEVPAAEKSQFEANARAAGLQGFEIWQKDAKGKRVPAANRAVFYPVIEVAPLAGNAAALGFDLGSEPIRRAALETARRSGLLSATDPVTLVQETGTQKGMLIYRPVFDSEDSGHLRGFCLAVLRMGSMISDMDPDHSASLDIKLLRVTVGPELLATSKDADKATAELATSRPVLAFGKVFLVTAHAGPEFMSVHALREGWLAATLGVGLTATIAAGISGLMRRRQELERIADEMRAQRESFRALTDNAPDAIARVDRHLRFVNVNRVMEKAAGLPSEALLGKMANDLALAASGELPEAISRVFQTGVRQSLRFGG